jgi:hypothetical protein
LRLAANTVTEPVQNAIGMTGDAWPDIAQKGDGGGVDVEKARAAGTIGDMFVRLDAAFLDWSRIVRVGSFGSTDPAISSRPGWAAPGDNLRADREEHVSWNVSAWIFHIYTHCEIAVAL